jgi:cell division protein FtsB
MRRDGRKTWLVRGAGAVLLAVTFGYVPYRLYAHSGVSRYLELERDLVRLRGQNEALRTEIARLAREAEVLRADVRAIERAARTDLGYVRPGEVIFDVGGGP